MAASFVCNPSEQGADFDALHRGFSNRRIFESDVENLSEAGQLACLSWWDDVSISPKGVGHLFSAHC